MPTPTKGPRLGGSPAHERLMLANLATALFEHDRITTTETKAKRLRPLAEKLITFAKRGDLHARRQVMTVIRDKDVVHKMFAEIGPNFNERPGGYTRITKIGPRKGDNAPMAVIELVEAVTAAQSVVKEGERARGTRLGARQAPKGRTAEIAQDAKGESPTAAAVAAEAEEEASEAAGTVPEAAGTVPEASDLAPEPSDVAPEPSDVAPEAADVAPEAADVVPGTPDVALEAPDVALEAPDVAPEAPDVVPAETAPAEAEDVTEPDAGGVGRTATAIDAEDTK